MTGGARPAAILAVLFAAATAFAQVAPDPAAAEREYALAERLKADGSPDAEAAFVKVVVLAPNGPLADDALVDLARLLGAPDWPEDVGVLDVAGVARIQAPLDKVVSGFPSGDRDQEARYRLALLRTAPVPGRDAARARRDLIALAALPEGGPWTAAARYALGVLDERSGAPDRAAGAYARIILEAPDSDAAPRACAGFARAQLFAGRFGDAAGWLQEAIERGAPGDLHADAQRALAVREVLDARAQARRWTVNSAKLPAIPTSRGANLVATAGDGRIVIFDRKSEALQAFDAKGAASAPVPLPGVTALATDPFGRVFAATKDRIVRWDSSGLANVVSLAAFGSPSAMAADASGAIWLADRRGERIGRWVPGTETPVVVRESKGSGVAALVATGERVVAAEEKTGKLIAVPASGPEKPFGAATFRRPVALCVDAAGRIAVLDAKAGTLTRLSPRGDVVDTLAFEPAGVSRPLAIAAAEDGAVRVLDGATGAVSVAP